MQLEFYIFLNYADFGLGTYHPKKGMYQVILAMETLAKEVGVSIKTDANVESILVENGTANGLIVNGKKEKCDLLEVYNQSDIEQLKKLPNNWKILTAISETEEPQDEQANT